MPVAKSAVFELRRINDLREMRANIQNRITELKGKQAPGEGDLEWEQFLLFRTEKQLRQSERILFNPEPGNEPYSQAALVSSPHNYYL